MNDTPPDAGPPVDLSLYLRLIGDGIAQADHEHRAVDHVTARRLAIWLAAWPQHRDFARSLSQFTQTGATTRELKAHLRSRARSADYPHRPQAARLLQYCLSRAATPGPLAPDFARACDDIDRSEAMLASLRDRISQGITLPPHQARPDAEARPVIALAAPDPRNRTVNLILDEATASIAVYAITAHAAEREAHAREVRRHGHAMPDGSYGRQNRQAIAARETRIAQRLRAIERAYHTAIEPDAAPAHDADATTSPGDHAADREIELE